MAGVFAKGTIPTIAEPADLFARPQFVETVNEQQVMLERAIAPYTFREKFPCGLQGCRTLHNKGLLVRTTDGRETNIGHICGKNHFRKDFEELRASLNREVAIERARTTLDATLARRGEIERRLEELIEGARGARWVERCKAQFRERFPDAIVQEVRRRAARRETAIYRDRRRSENEIETLKAAGMEASPIEQEHVGTLRGLAAWHESAGQLRHGVEDTLDTIAALDRDTTDQRRLQALAKRAGEIDSTLEALEEFLAAGRAFFSPDNFEVLPLLTNDEKERRQLADVRWEWGELGPTKTKPR